MIQKNGWFYLLVALLIKAESQFPEFCSMPTASVIGGVNIVTKVQNDTARYMGAVHSLAALNETLCYKAKYRRSGEQVSRLYTVQFTGLTQHYPVKNSYKFVIPEVSAKCYCKCGGGGKECTEQTHNCEEQNSTCKSIYVAGQTSSGCVWMGGHTHTCCSVIMSPGESPVFTAIQLSSYETRLQFKVAVLDLDNGSVIRSPEHITIEATAGLLQLDEAIVLKVASSGVRRLIPSNMYHMLNSTLFTGVQLNKLNEWDTSKLGWMKMDENGNYRVMEGAVENKVFRIMTRDCGKNDIKLRFHGNYYKTPRDKSRDREHDFGVPFEKYYKGQVQSIKVEDILVTSSTNAVTREVKLSAASVPRISLTFYASEKTEESVLLYDKSKLGAFTHATLTYDSYGNGLLTVKLFSVVGNIVGYIKSRKVTKDNKTEVLFEDVNFYVTTNIVGEINISEAVTSTCILAAEPATPGIGGGLGKVSVCLKALASGPNAKYLCVHGISCTSQSARAARIVRPDIQIYCKKEMSLDNYRLSSWYKHATINRTLKGQLQVEELIFVFVYLCILAGCVVVFYKRYIRLKKINHPEDLCKRITSFSSSCTNADDMGIKVEFSFSHNDIETKTMEINEEKNNYNYNSVEQVSSQPYIVTMESSNVEDVNMLTPTDTMLA